MKRFIACVLVVVCFFSIAACNRQQKESEDIRNRIVDSIFLYEKEGIGGKFTIQINGDGTFEYYEGFLSSYIGMGDWVLDGDTLVLSEDEQKTGRQSVNYFRVDGSDLFFLSENSSNFLYVKVADGERFIYSPDEVLE